jgi:PAS domain S-box-containing protein
VLVLVLVAVLPALISTIRTLDRLQSRYDPTADATTGLLEGALNQETAIRGYALTEDQDFLDPFTEGSAQIERAQQFFTTASLSEAVRREYEDTIAAYRAWQEYADEVERRVATGDTAGAVDLVRGGVGKERFDAFRAAHEGLQRAVDGEVVAKREDLRETVVRSIVSLIVVVGAGVALVIGLWLWWRLAGRRQAEAERRLADTGVLMQAVIDATTDSIFAKDTEGRHILANRARAAAVSGGDPDTPLLGRTVDEFLDPPLAARIREDERLVIADGIEREIDEVLRQPDGPHVFLTRKSALHDATGNVIGVVGVARDVTEERALRADRERLYQMEHELATTLQRSMLGRGALDDDDRLEICARYQPAAAQLSVGGDWYDVVALPDTTIGLVVGDVVGHGIESATAMGQLRSALSALAFAGEDPATTLEALEAFAFTIPAAHSATCAYAVVDPENQRLTYSSAGHMPPLVLVPGAEAHQLDEVQDLPLAATRTHRRRRNTTIEFPVGATLLLYTDGLVERRTEVIDEGLRRLAATASEHRELSVNALCDRVITDLLAGQHQRDDVAIVGARLLRAHAKTENDAESTAPRREWTRS